MGDVRPHPLDGDIPTGILMNLPKPAEWEQLTDEQRWGVIRNWRDTLLSSSDWTQLSDSPLSTSTKAAWKAYRTSLREIPQNYANPDDVVWPEEPS